MSDAPKSASGTPNGIRMSLKDAATPLTPKDSVKVTVIPSARPPAVVSRAIRESRELLGCRRSPEEFRASTSNTPAPTLRCPVTGNPIPSLEEIEEKIGKNLTLSNWRWPRSIAVKGIALALQRWASEVGLEKAARRGEVLLSSGRPLEYADPANLPWIDPKKIEALTPEAFADRLGGIVDEFERNDGDANGTGDQRLLSSARAPSEGSGADGTGSADGGVEAGRGGGTREHGPVQGGSVVAFPAGGSCRRGNPGLHREHVVLELREHEQDLGAFTGAYNRVHRRVQEVKDEGRLMKLVEWSGTSAVMGSLEMAIHAIERVVAELRDVLQRIDAGVIPNLDEGDDV